MWKMDLSHCVEVERDRHLVNCEHVFLSTINKHSDWGRSFACSVFDRACLVGYGLQLSMFECTEIPRRCWSSRCAEVR